MRIPRLRPAVDGIEPIAAEPIGMIVADGAEQCTVFVFGVPAAWRSSWIGIIELFGCDRNVAGRLEWAGVAMLEPRVTTGAGR